MLVIPSWLDDLRLLATLPLYLLISAGNTLSRDVDGLCVLHSNHPRIAWRENLQETPEADSVGSKSQGKLCICCHQHSEVFSMIQQPVTANNPWVAARCQAARIMLVADPTFVEPARLAWERFCRREKRGMLHGIHRKLGNSRGAGEWSLLFFNFVIRRGYHWLICPKRFVSRRIKNPDK